METINLFWFFYTMVVILTVLYSFLVATFDYFKDQGIPGPAPYAIFGNRLSVWKSKICELDVRRYEMYGKIFGVFEGRTPNIFIGDPDILRKIFIKDFDRFVNRPIYPTKNQYLDRNLIVLLNEEWTDVRTALSSIFTTTKIKKMSVSVSETAARLSTSFAKYADGEKKVNLQIGLEAFAMDLIETCGFGTKLDNVGRLVPISSKHFSSSNSLNVLKKLVALCPRLARVFPSSEVGGIENFVNIAKSILENQKSERQKEKGKRNYFLDFLLEASQDKTIKGNPLKNDEVLIAQILHFLLIGFQTTVNSIGLMLHCLALSPDVQMRLRKEIKSGLKKHKIASVDFIEDLPYLEQCILETLRMYPPVVRTERICHQPTFYREAKMIKGCIVTIPIYAMHRDPEFYPDPLIYNPERFTVEEKRKRDPITFLPFGHGPRNCIGLRYAMQIIKIAICALLTEYRFFPVTETMNPPQFKKGASELLQTESLYVGIEKVKF